MVSERTIPRPLEIPLPKLYPLNFETCPLKIKSLKLEDGLGGDKGAKRDSPEMCLLEVVIDVIGRMRIIFQFRIFT